MQNVYLFELSAVSAKRIISELACKSESVFFTDHARSRMKTRRITTTQVFDCLKKGLIREEPVFNNKYGTWEVKLEVVTAGDIVSVVAALKKEISGYVIIVTVYKGE